MKPLAVAVLAMLLAGAACSSRAPAPANQSRHEPSGRVLRVPEDHATIGAAVAAARSGDLVLIAPGEYREAVVVDTPGIVIRGLDRTRVVLNGGDQLDNGILVEADGVAVENLTVRNYTVNGVLFTRSFSADRSAVGVDDPLLGYRASYITAANNGLYGIYAFAARGGLIEHSYASGHPDSGIYIGQCKPCDAVVTDTVGERNAVGYEGTNASGNLSIVNSIWRRNRVGMTPNSQNYEKLAPQGEALLAGNAVVDNAEPATPEHARGAFGLGIVVGGGVANRLVRNLVSGHPGVGIALTDLDGYAPERNEIRGNVLDANALDLAYYLSSTAPKSGNCFAGNRFQTSLPADIEAMFTCSRAAGTPERPASAPRLAAAPRGVDYRKMPLPEPQPSLPDAATAPARPASATPPRIDLDTIVVPARPT